ncbi:hypothetical protein N7488_011645 [Penicillium malachiteum]|nr:hypothetical protein N7488_011645 [Penicillium malachiteum]
MTHLTDLSNELLREIIKHLLQSKDICALSQANHRLYALATEQLNSKLHQIFKSKGKTYRERHAFRWAVQEGKDSCVRKFLKTRPEILHSSFESHPIIFAARQGHTKVVQAFLEYGIDPNYPTGSQGLRNRNSFRNPLTVAAEHGHESVVRLLIEHGVQLEFDRQDIDEQPLALATKGRHIEVANLLLDHGCNPHTPGRRGSSAWRIAAESDLNILRLFIDRGAEPIFFVPGSSSFGPKNEYHWTMVNALHRLDMPLVKFLFEQGVELEQPLDMYDHVLEHIHDRDPLYKIGRAIGERPEDAEFLISKIALDGIVNGNNLRSLVSLMVGAVCGGAYSLTKLLLEADRSSKRPTVDSSEWKDHLSSCMVVAIWSDHINLVELLLDYGADPRGVVKDRLARDGYRPPIFRAAKKGRADIIELLLDRGANPFPRQPRTVFEIACHNLKTPINIVRMLIERDILTPKTGYARNNLKTAVMGGVEVFQLVIQHMGIKLQRGDPFHEEAFREAVELRRTCILELFVKAGFGPTP